MSLAVPVKDGVVLLDGDAGEFKVTVGAAEASGFTVNVTGALLPVSDARLVCVACAVYVPACRSSAGPRDHMPLNESNRVLNSCTTVPSGVPPLYILSVTSRPAASAKP